MRIFLVIILIIGNFYCSANALVKANDLTSTPHHEKMFTTNPFTHDSGSVYKGAMRATIHNISKLDSLLEESNAENNQRVAEIIAYSKELVPSLDLIGFFDLFSPVEWLENSEHQGRYIIALVYLQQHDDKIEDNVKTRLEKLYDDPQVSSFVKNEILKITPFTILQHKVEEITGQ